jgi:hypothetical protein
VLSTPTDRLDDPRSASFYAPKSGRTLRLGEVSQAASALKTTLVPDAGDPPAAAATRPLRAHRSLDPAVPPGPPLRFRTRLATIGRLAAIVAAAAVAALILIGQFPFPALWPASAPDQPAQLAASSSRPAPSVATPRSEPAFPRLVVQNARGNKGDPAPLGVTLQGSADGAFVMITGLLGGMTLSNGSAVGSTAWQIAVSDLNGTWIHPPKDFVGTADLVAELRLADNTVAHRRPIRLEWMAPAAPPTPKLDGGEIAALLKRGNDLVANGDLAAARLVLLPAAQAGDAEAALALAATYDPVVLHELALHGFAADAATARAWYEKARELGSPEAARRLDVLASGAH